MKSMGVFVVAVLGFVALSARCATNDLSWAHVPHAAVEAAAYKRVDSVTFVLRPVDGRIAVMERFTLFDASTNVVRVGTREMTQAQFVDKLEAGGETLARFKAIIKAACAK